ncbi:MAG: hypothetical protein F2662_01455 [Actinobacteria bacterium]|uniref:Unannotated protein n=1 Tax=freshwater metagenome TaxID=449393 RepID=A0A6J6N8K9_9ZZZZ|nr:hypothetical protein [Actinomycetota bacterium]
MLLLTTLLVSGLWYQAPSCPPAFSFTNTTVGALSDSAELSLCVRNAVLVKGSNGSVSLAIGAPTATAPRCLVYPNGLSPDLMASLLQSGHVGCWSLYPPSQPIAIVNIGKPSQTKLSAALKSFRPTTPSIFVKPSSGILVGTGVQLSSSANLQLIKTKLLGLAAQIRFKPLNYKWQITDNGSSASATISEPRYLADTAGKVQVNLAISYSVEYIFSGLNTWTRVRPNIISNATPVAFQVGQEVVPPKTQIPRLVARPCVPKVISWGC